jgi:hypothetical protein
LSGVLVSKVEGKADPSLRLPHFAGPQAAPLRMTLPGWGARLSRRDRCDWGIYICGKSRSFAAPTPTSLGPQAAPLRMTLSMLVFEIVLSQSSGKKHRMDGAPPCCTNSKLLNKSTQTTGAHSRMAGEVQTTLLKAGYAGDSSGDWVAHGGGGIGCFVLCAD